MTAQQTRSFADTGIARLIALVLAALIAYLLWANWADEIRQVMQGEDAAVPMVSKSEPAKPANPALEKCLEQRIGDVDRMKQEGILSDAQYEAFKGRAMELCTAQNPG